MKIFNNDEMAIYKSKYKLGQTLYGIVERGQEVDCDICDGTGQVEIKEAYFGCPNCRAKGKVFSEDNAAYSVIKQEITSISMTDEKYNKVRWHYTTLGNVWVDIDEFDTEKYIGNVKFTTRKKAEKFIELLEANKE